jgi:hypothetical protein
VNILQAIADKNIFRPFLGEDLSTWQAWNVALRCLYGLKIKPHHHDLIKQCTGRDASELPSEGFRTALIACGRRSGKSRVAALVGGYEALFGGHERRLAKGEVGLLPIISPTKFQSSVVWRYLQSLFDTPLLRPELLDVKESDKLLQLKNGIRVMVLTGDFRSVRGPTLIGAVVDEICHFHLSEENKIRSDSELIAALKPGLATTQGRLICIGSKYATRGWAYKTWLAQQGVNRGVSPSFREQWQTLVWEAPSKLMNCTLPQSVIGAALVEDLASARSEYLNEWRCDVAEFVPRSLVESLVARGIKELLPRSSTSYTAFCDVSGGRSDAAALSIGHLADGKVILDCARLWPAPHNPHVVIAQMCDELKRFSLNRVIGDNFGAEFVAGSFRGNGVNYTKSDFPKSQLYLELLPRLCSQGIELLDLPVLIDQLSSLERKTRSGGRDVIDHPAGGRDDLSNSVAGLSAHVVKRRIRIGGMW